MERRSKPDDRVCRVYARSPDIRARRNAYWEVVDILLTMCANIAVRTCQSDDATRFYPLGDAALVCEVPPPATLDCQRRVWAVAEAARAWPDVIDVVPGMNNLTIVFDALATTAESLTPALRDAWETADVEHADGREVEIPVEYGGAAGPICRPSPRIRPVGRRSRRAPRGRRLRRVLRRLPAGLRVSRRADAALHMPRAAPGGAGRLGRHRRRADGHLPGHVARRLATDRPHVARTVRPARPQPTLLLPGDRVRFTIAGVDAR